MRLTFGVMVLIAATGLSACAKKGLRELAMLNHKKAVRAADRLAQINGISLLNDSFFNEFTLVLDSDARPLVRKLAEQKILAGVSLGRLYPEAEQLAHGLVVAVTETVSDDDVETLATALQEELA